MENSQIVLTSSSLLDFLVQIDELSNYDIMVSETPDGNIQVAIGDSFYSIDTEHAEDVQVAQETVEEVADINEEAYKDIIDSDETMEEISVDGGIISEMVKTLAIGGLTRLAGKAVKDVLN